MKALGKPEQSGRTAKLCRIFALIKGIILKDESSFLAEMLELMALPLDTPYSIVKDSIRECLIDQGFSDKIELLKGQLEYLGTMAKTLKKFSPEATVTDSLRSIMKNFHPIGKLFSLHTETYDNELTILEKGNASEIIDIYINKVLAGSTFNMGVFSMRKSHSRVFNQSRLVKDVWLKCKILLKLIDSNNIDRVKEANLLMKKVSRLQIRRSHIKA